MKKLVFALVLAMCASVFSVDAYSSDTEIKRLTIEAIRDEDMTPVVDLLRSIEPLDARQRVRVLKAVELGFNHPASFVRERAGHALFAVIKALDGKLCFIVRKGTDGQWKLCALTNGVKFKDNIPSYTVERRPLTEILYGNEKE